MSDGEDVNLILPVEEHNEVRESLEDYAAGSMQIGGKTKRKDSSAGKSSQQVVGKSARGGKAPLGVPDCGEIGLTPCGLVNPQTLHRPTTARNSASTSANE